MTYQTKFIETHISENALLDYVVGLIGVYRLSPCKESQNFLAGQVNKRYPFISGYVRYTDKVLTVYVQKS
jgi:hypothetical protein